MTDLPNHNERAAAADILEEHGINLPEVIGHLRFDRAAANAVLERDSQNWGGDIREFLDVDNGPGLISLHGYFEAHHLEAIAFLLRNYPEDLTPRRPRHEYPGIDDDDFDDRYLDEPHGDRR